MGSTNSLWVEVAVVTTIFAVGGLVGHFEAHQPACGQLSP
jgi:hypothetical protein